MFDSRSGRAEPLPSSLERFLTGGPPPLVFTLGTFASKGDGDFYHQSAETARRLGARAVLLTGRHSPPEQDGDIYWCDYAPHSLLFPRASAIIHHGGIGTVGQAMSAGKPQLVVPHMGDQYDHAHRVVRLGLGLSLSAVRFDADRAAPLIRRLLNDPTLALAAILMGDRMANEQGAETAAAAIETALSERSGINSALD